MSVGRKNQENITANDWTWNIFADSFSIGELASLIFITYLVILSFTSTNNFQHIQGLSLNNFHILPPPLNRL